MTAGNLGSIADFVREEECPTSTWPIHRLEVWSIGRYWVGICQRCGRLKHINQGAEPWTHATNDVAVAQHTNPGSDNY